MIRNIRSKFCQASNGEKDIEQPLADTTAESANTQNIENGTAAAASPKDAKPKMTRAPKQRGPPEDGIPSKNKVMVANLPYDLSEDKVS